jgi:sulfatase maturation enzyme AslB (radical SAM superfamily)
MENLLYCSAGYNRIIVSSDGKIYRCFSRMKNNISDIYNYDFNKDWEIKKCDQLGCIQCDKNFTIRDSDINKVREKVNYVNWQLTITDYCKNFCPYCFHSDNTVKYNFPIHRVNIIDFIDFINNINSKIRSYFFLVGGEPLYREDIYQLNQLNKDIHIFTSLICDYNNLDKFLFELKNFNHKVYFIVTIHYYSKLFNWDLFWYNFDKVYKNNCCKISRCSILDYNLNNDIIKNIKDKLLKYGLTLEIKFVDKTMIPDRSIKKKFKLL